MPGLNFTRTTSPDRNRPDEKDDNAKGVARLASSRAKRRNDLLLHRYIVNRLGQNGKRVGAAAKTLSYKISIATAERSSRL
jgi:hypothetical protein